MSPFLTCESRENQKKMSSENENTKSDSKNIAYHNHGLSVLMGGLTHTHFGTTKKNDSARCGLTEFFESHGFFGEHAEQI